MWSWKENLLLYSIKRVRLLVYIKQRKQIRRFLKLLNGIRTVQCIFKNWMDGVDTSFWSRECDQKKLKLKANGDPTNYWSVLLFCFCFIEILETLWKSRIVNTYINYSTPAANAITGYGYLVENSICLPCFDHFSIFTGISPV